MSAEKALLNAEQAYKSHHYEDALNFYRDAENSGAIWTDEQLFRYAKLLLERGKTGEAVLQAEKISDAGQDDFDIAVFLFRLKKDTGVADSELIILLENICRDSYDDEMMYNLAELYAKNNSAAKSKRVCKQIIHTFRSGEWLEKARALLDAGCVLFDGALVEARTAPVKTNEVEARTVPVKTNKTAKPIVENVKPIGEKTKDSKSNNDGLPDFLLELFEKEGIVGMDEVKTKLKEIYNLIRHNKLLDDGTDSPIDTDESYNFILSGNPGTGKTTVARIIGNALFRLKVRENNNFIEVDRGKIVGNVIGDTAKLTKAAIDTAKGGTLFIDEAYSLYKKESGNDFGKEAIDTLLKDMEDNRSEYSVIMAGYRKQMTEMLNHANPGFRSRFTHHIDIPDFTDSELIQIAHNIAGKKGHTIASDGDEALRKRIKRERIDETFGNARFIRGLMNEAIRNKANRFAEKGYSEDEVRIIKAEDICPPNEETSSLDELMSRLNKLTGLDDVKKSIEDLKAQIRVQKLKEERGILGSGASASMHMSFKGNAGTGKTTVARLLGRILGELGVLKRGNVFVECTRADLVGEYLGQTAPKVKEAVREAMGGVLFIDEAYSLVSGGNDSFGQEAVSTLVAEMENHRDSLVVILAGYTADIDKFLQTNQGLRSRVTRDLFFADYSPDEMSEIFCGMAASEGLQMDEKLRHKVKSLFEEKSKIPDFGNGRGVRNVFDKVVQKQNIRIDKMESSGENLSREDLVTMLAEDFDNV